jgi:hypothetical protein
MILVKFWFWSFWFFWTQRDYVAGRFGAMRFPQPRQQNSTEANQGNEDFSPWFPSFASVHIGIEPGRRPAFEKKKNETGWKRPPSHHFGATSCPTLSEVVTNELQISLASAEFGVPFNGTL